MKTSLTRRIQEIGGDWDARPAGSHDPAGSKRQSGAEGGPASNAGTGSRVSGFPSVSDTPRNSASDRQFQRFLDAVDNLNSHLANTFDDGYPENHCSC